MHIIAPKTLRQAALTARDAARERDAWVTVVKSARWRSLVELQRSFPDADYVKPYVVFNMRGNRCRLVTRVYFVRSNKNGSQSEGHIYIRAFLTHKQYDDRKNWE